MVEECEKGGGEMVSLLMEKGDFDRWLKLGKGMCKS